MKEILYSLVLTFSLMALISILEHQFMGIQFPDIMADSIDAKQMLVILNSKLDYIIYLLTGDGHEPISELIGTKVVIKYSSPEN